MVSKQRVLVAGATGYLGKFLVRELKNQGHWVRALSRDSGKARDIEDCVNDLFIGQVTEPGTLEGICRDIDVVVSSLGITKQKDGLTYMDVDYRGNRNLLNEAISAGVEKFMYVSVLNADKLRHLEIVKAKEKFADELKKAELESIIVRPNGFFSDMTEFFRMAQGGRAYLFGKGDFKANPIHGADLAEFCVNSLAYGRCELDVGGPEILTQKEIILEAFSLLSKKPRIIYIPLWIKNLIVWLMRTFTSSKTYGPLEFFMTVLAMDMVAPACGRFTIREYFKELAR